MKSFALHLIVIFIVGIEYQQIGTSCASGLAASTLDQFNTTSGTLQTVKTPRTIQRLIGGHLQHNPDHNPQDTYGNNATQLSKVYFRRKPIQQSRNSYRSGNGRNSTILKKLEVSLSDSDEDIYSDAALLEDPKELDNWDNGILRSSAGAGKEETAKTKKKDDSKKTLAEQVAEGKYGLIEKELFQKTPKRPGVLSYLTNKDNPNDNSKNYGGLKEDDIWLAEDDLLVLKGGDLNTKSNKEPWKPIDDYQAPNRQIKIPANPKVPPPFPVQFEDNGPLQFIGNHQGTFFDPFSNESIPLYSEDGNFYPEGGDYDEKNILTGTRPFKNLTKSKGVGYFYTPPNQPWLGKNQTFVNPFVNLIPTQYDGQAPPGDGSYDAINGTDYIDEDDPSLYYPPAYSFIYDSNYSSAVPPGPLVPGIVLPPPPNAFARLEDPQRKTKQKEIPFGQILTKITERKPTTTATSTTSSTTPYTTSTLQSTTITSSPPRSKPVYYTKDVLRLRPYSPKQPKTTTRPPKLDHQPEFIQFVPEAPSNTDTNSKGNPVYYEYFDARQSPPPSQVYYNHKSPVVASSQRNPRPQQQHHQQQQQQPPLTASVQQHQQPPPQQQQLPPPQQQQLPPQPEQQQPRPYTKKIQVTSTRPIFKEITRLLPESPPQRLSKSYLPTKPYNYDDYLYITPKPEIRPNGISNQFIPPNGNQQYPNFDREIDAIRQTLQFYNSHQLQENHIPRTPKGKAVYEYSFDATVPPAKTKQIFNPPAQFDQEPFKPMVQYSRPVDDANGFKAMTYTQTEQPPTTLQPVYYTSTDTTPTQRTNTRLSGKSYLQPINYNTTPQSASYTNEDQINYSQGRPQSYQYPTPRTGVTPNRPWFTIEKQIVQEVPPQQETARPSSQKEINRNNLGYSRNINSGQAPFTGYYYSQPGSNRPNQKYYQYTSEQPFAQHISSIKAQLNQYQQQQQQQHHHQQQQHHYQQQHHQQQQQQQQQQRLPISLENDTYVNFRPGRPPVNPDAEFISLQRRQQYSNLPQSQAQRLPPPPPPNQHPPQYPSRQYQPVPLNRDILVNYKLPLPPINPESEYIQPQIVNRNTPQYRPALQYRVPNEGQQQQQQQPGVYYYNPREVRRYKKSIYN